MVNRGNKLLDYVKLLDSSIQVGGFTHFFGMDTHIQDGNIRNAADLESFMRCQMHPSITRLEGMAIKGIYSAADQNDTWRLALIDKLVHVQRTPANQREQASSMGKRLIKLAHALHPWIDFSPLEDTLAKYESVGCLSTVHAWVNHHLGIPVEDAVQGYLHSAMSACITEAARTLAWTAMQANNCLHAWPQTLTRNGHWSALPLPMDFPLPSRRPSNRFSPASTCLEQASTLSGHKLAFFSPPTSSTCQKSTPSPAGVLLPFLHKD